MSDREIDTMNTSSIDLICCALGGLLLIMLFVATLVRAKAENSALEPRQGGEERGNRAAGLSGLREAPQRLMLITLRWTGRAKYPPQLLAYPPAWKDGKLGRRDDAELRSASAENALTEARGLVRIPHGDSFYGFFSRKAGRGGDGGSVELIVPRASRHAPDWKFVLVYRDDTAAISPLGVDPRKTLEQAFAEMNAWKDRAGGAWQLGPTPAGTDERTRRLRELVRTEMIPRLNDQATRPTEPAERHNQAMKLVAAIDQALERGMSQSDDVTWENDLLSPSGPIEAARSGGADWLGRIHDYATLFAGTDPDAPGCVEFTLTGRAFLPPPSSPVRLDLAAHGQPETGTSISLCPGETPVVFGPP